MNRFLGNQPFRKLLSLPLLFMLPAALPAQDYVCATNNGTITITQYTGPGGDVAIPGTLNGLPVTGIGVAAFQSLATLTSVAIPAGVTSIGYDAFTSCSNLAAITVDPLNPAYSSLDGVLFDRNQFTLVEYPGGRAGSYSIPDSVNFIADDAFHNCAGLAGVTFTDGVSSIGDSAFESCSTLAAVTLPNNVASLGTSAFEGCSGLAAVTLSGRLTRLADRTFFFCTNLTGIVIPNGITNIGIDVFSYCSNLVSVTLPESVTSLDIFSFNGCASLATIVIPMGVTNISDYAFHDDANLTGIYFEGNPPDDASYAFDGANRATVYYLPETGGWGSSFDGRPTAPWKPQIQTGNGSFGVRMNQFGFNLAWAGGTTVIVEAATNLVNPAWSPLQTNFLAAGSFYFSDPQWSNHPARFYRLRWP